MAYWDTSCLIKLYAPEPDSANYKALVLRGGTLVTSEIARFELHAALWRKQVTNGLPADGARQALAAFDGDAAVGLIHVWPLDSMVARQFEGVIERCYRLPSPVALRTLDAIHVATAATAGETEMVATDKRLRDAALSLGLAVYPRP